MNKPEVMQLLAYAQNFDNRKITDGMVDAWAEVLSAIPFDFGRQAVVEAFKDETVKWLEPKHVFKYAKPLMDRKRVEEDRAKTLQEMAERTSSPMPKCKHGLGLLWCVPCCKSVAGSR